DDHEITDVDLVGARDVNRIGDLTAVDVGAVGALEVAHLEHAVAVRDLRMPFRHVALGQNDVVPGHTPNRNLVLVEGQRLGLAALFGDGELDHAASGRLRGDSGPGLGSGWDVILR